MTVHKRAERPYLAKDWEALAAPPSRPSPSSAQLLGFDLGFTLPLVLFKRDTLTYSVCWEGAAPAPAPAPAPPPAMLPTRQCDRSSELLPVAFFGNGEWGGGGKDT
jgi:hypothetical protein